MDAGQDAVLRRPLEASMRPPTGLGHANPMLAAFNTPPHAGVAMPKMPSFGSDPPAIPAQRLTLVREADFGLSRLPSGRP